MNTAPSLHELQTGFTGWMLGQQDAALPGAVAGNGLTPEMRLQVYRNIVFNNLTAALRTAYPAVLKLVGEEFFEGAAARYIRDYPSASGNLQDFGAQFADCLTSMPEAAGLPWLADMARLEWARQLAYLAADGQALAPAALAAISDSKQGDLRLGLHPGVRLLESNHPLLDIWDFCQREQVERLTLRDQGVRLLIWRAADGQVAMQSLTLGHFAFLHALQADNTLSAAHESASRAETDFDLGACLHGLFSNCLITSYSFK